MPHDSLFPVIKKPSIFPGEIVLVRIFEGKTIAGVVDEVFDDYFILRASKDPDSKKERFSFKIDQVIKTN